MVFVLQDDEDLNDSDDEHLTDDEHHELQKLSRSVNAEGEEEEEVKENMEKSEEKWRKMKRRKNGEKSKREESVKERTCSMSTGIASRSLLRMAGSVYSWLLNGPARGDTRVGAAPFFLCGLFHYCHNQPN